MDFIKIFGLTLNINPVALNIFGFKIFWYGIIIATGFGLAVLYGFKKAKTFDIDTDRLVDAVLVTAPAAIIGARLYYVIFSGLPISDFFAIRNGGLAILGAVIFAGISAVIMCRIRKINIIDTLDLAALGFLIGQSIGRWGNFVNQEAYGSVTGSSWFGMTGSKISADIGSTALVHPCFLYESLWCAGGFLLLHMLSKNRKFKGQLASLYLIWYGFGRFFIEGLRTDSLYIGDSFIRVSQLLSALMVIAGVVIYILLYLKENKKVPQPEYVPMFSNETDEIQTKNESEENENGDNN